VSAAGVAAFKAQSAALIDRHHLTPPEVVGLGLSMAASYALTNGISQAAVRQALEDSFARAEAGLPGICSIAEAAND
jgi:hypothetical protein